MYRNAIINNATIENNIASTIKTSSSSRYCAQEMFAAGERRCLAPPCRSTYSIHHTARSSGRIGSSCIYSLSLAMLRR